MAPVFCVPSPQLSKAKRSMQAMFRKVRDVLRLDGYFVLEPQPWRSYRQAHSKLVRTAIILLTFHLYHALSSRSDSKGEVIGAVFWTGWERGLGAA